MQKKHKNFFYKIIAVSIILSFISSRTVFFRKGTLENIGSTITYPFLIIASGIVIPLKNYINRNHNVETLHKQLNKKIIENEGLLKENIKLKASLHHKARTKDLEAFQERYKIDGIFTKILIKNIDDTEHYYIINKGSKSGIVKDMVMLYKFQLVGKVEDVFKYHSKIKLVTDSKSKIAVYTNMTNANGIVIGNNSKNKCQLAYVSHLSKVENGDLVLSSGQGLVFPEGFCLGRIINSKVNGFIHSVELEPMVDLSSLNFGVLVDKSQIINF